MEPILYNLASHVVDAGGYWLTIILTQAAGIPRGSLAGFGVYGSQLYPKSFTKQTDGSYEIKIMSMVGPSALETVRVGLHHMYVDPTTGAVEDSYQTISMLNTIPASATAMAIAREKA